jgi:hypothetical protein
MDSERGRADPVLAELVAELVHGCSGDVQASRHVARRHEEKRALRGKRWRPRWAISGKTLGAILPLR